MLKLRPTSMIAVGLLTGMLVSSVQAATPLTTRRVASGLSLPVFVTHAPGDSDRIFILEKRGIVKVMQIGSGAVSTVMNIDSIVGGGTSEFNEQGLLGMAFHRDWETNGYFYVYYTNNAGDTQVSRYTLVGNTASTGTAFPIITIDQPQGNHNGGWIGFGPNDNYLYVALGDGGGANDTGTGHTTATGNAQDITSNLLGKLLRIDVDNDDFPGSSTANYAIPADNPFVGVTGDDEIWVYGLRNPWRCGWDWLTGDLFIGDVGQNAWEEVDVLPGGARAVRISGGDAVKARHNFNFQAYCSALTFVEPIQEYSHGFGCSITGGEVYRGCAIPDLRGTYFYADYCSDIIWSIRYDRDTNTSFEFTTRTAELAPGMGQSITGISSFGLDNDGEIYICDQPGGEIFKIIAASPADPPADNDYDNDGDIDLLDLDGLVNCLNEGGPALKVDCLCDVFNDDGDGDVDLSSFARFQRDF